MLYLRYMIMDTVLWVRSFSSSPFSHACMQFQPNIQNSISIAGKHFECYYHLMGPSSQCSQGLGAANALSVYSFNIGKLVSFMCNVYLSLGLE